MYPPDVLAERNHVELPRPRNESTDSIITCLVGLHRINDGIAKTEIHAFRDLRQNPGVLLLPRAMTKGFNGILLHSNRRAWNRVAVDCSDSSGEERGSRQREDQDVICR